MNDKYKPVRKKGAYNRDRTKKWDGTKWVAVNVVHRGQKATLNGKPVQADGKGNWRSPGTRGNSLEGTKPGRVAGSYQSGDRNRKPSNTSKPSTSKPNNASAINARLRKQKEERERALARTGNSSNTPKPKPEPPKTSPSPAPTRSAPTRSAPTRSAPTRAKAKPTPATSSSGQNLRQGRSPDKPATKPTKPAGKVYGSTGRKDLKQSSRMADALKSLKVRDYKKKK